jgi:hypothetical protein
MGRASFNSSDTAECRNRKRRLDMKRTVISMMTGALLLGGVLGGVSNVLAQTNEVNQRERNQQERIGQGVESGSLTAGETSHLEKQESGINQEVRQDRKANGGTLTAQEHRQVNRQQNRESRRIYRDKHNGKTQ